MKSPNYLFIFIQWFIFIHFILPKLYLDFPFGANVFIRKTDADGVSAAQFDLVQNNMQNGNKNYRTWIYSNNGCAVPQVRTH